MEPGLRGRDHGRTSSRPGSQWSGRNGARPSRPGSPGVQAWVTSNVYGRRNGARPSRPGSLAVGLLQVADELGAAMDPGLRGRDHLVLALMVSVQSSPQWSQAFAAGITSHGRSAHATAKGGPQWSPAFAAGIT